MKTICFSLWGSDKKYTYGAIENAKLAKIIYPEWKCIFYINSSVPDDIVSEIKKNDCNIVDMKDSGLNDSSGLFWRFLGMGDNITHYISRDADSRLNWREKHAVDEWISSGKKFHIMKDHFYHMRWNMLGGMFGCVGGVFMDIEKMISDYIGENIIKYNDDQIFLSKIIYPIIKNDVLIHDLKSKWPRERDGLDHVGSIYNHDNVRLTNFRDI
jgi:hypothetical protein